MSAKGNRRAAKPSLVLVFGEHDHDRRATVELAIALRPELKGRCETRRHPLVLVKNANVENLPRHADRLRNVIQAEQEIRNIKAALVHEDCDAVEPAHQHVAHRIESSLNDVGCPVHAVVPAWELETWLMLWPEAAPLVCSSWREPVEFTGKQVGLIANAKEVFAKALVSHHPKATRHKVRQYREADSPDLARQVRERSWASTPRAKSDSFDRFRTSLNKIDIA